jgi:aminopeptidase N
MGFTLKLANIMHRLGYNEKTVNLGNWYPVACVYENGEFRAEPYYSNGDPFYSDMANYEVTMTVPSKAVLASTGEVKSASESGGKSTYNLSARAVRDFAMCISDNFKTITGKAGKTSVTYYYYDEEKPEASLKAAIDSITTFNGMFGEYPYKTLAVAKTGFMHGGMEYPNLVFISDAANMKDEYYQEVIIHEVAHQWWYGVVGNDQIRDAWMDEGLADYSVTLFYERNTEYNQKRSDRIMQTMKEYLVYTDIIKAYMQKDKTLDTSMNRALNQYNTESEYVYMTYAKGHLLFDNLRNTIGDKSFFDGIKDYYAKNMFKNVKQEHMIGAFESASGKDLNGYFNAWIKGNVLITDLY